MPTKFATFAGLFALLTCSFAQSNPTVLCIAGQCLQGSFSTTLGGQLSAPGLATLQLLPGQYDSRTSPQLLNDALTSSSARLVSSPGFPNSSALPLDLSLQPGYTAFPERFYSGQASFAALPTKSDAGFTPLNGRSIFLSNNVFVAINTSSNSRIVLWEAVPDMSQLPRGAQGSLTISAVQSTSCAPACASGGICTANGQCQCAAGFTGPSCESCSPGFFGPTCQKCSLDDGCEECDDGVSGTGRCKTRKIAGAPAGCGCVNGACGAGGQCECSAGFGTATDGTLCASCQSGFFLTSTGDCRACQLGCAECAQDTGACTTCKPGFVLDGNDRTRCNPQLGRTSAGALCPEGSFASGSSCVACAAGCEQCRGPATTDCLVCGRGTFAFNGGCISANVDGVCQGTTLIANNLKKSCDSCGAKCLACRIPNFSVASTIEQRTCTRCVPGHFLSNGECIEKCPAGTTVSPQDGMTCVACDPSCSSCSGSPSFCVTCANNQLANSEGRCVASCPSGTFTSSGSCTSCHADCAGCSGSSFNQCTSCPPSRPVLANGRCLPTCTKSQFLDTASSTCQACDASCSSCSGPGASNCLACSGTSSVLRGGSCSTASCSTVAPGLGVCLSELVKTSEATPGPDVVGIDKPVSPRFKLEWWQILLMVLGCVFIFCVVFWCCCKRRQKKKKAAAAATGHLYVTAVQDKSKSGWKERLVSFGERFFGHKKTKKRTVLPIVHLGPQVQMKETSSASGAIPSTSYPSTSSRTYLAAPAPSRPLRSVSSDESMDRFIGSYNRPSTPEADGQRVMVRDDARKSVDSIYSQQTEQPLHRPNILRKQSGPPPTKDSTIPLTSRFSMTTVATEPPRRGPFWR